MKMKVAPSILSVLNQDLTEIIKKLEQANITYLHLDVMDNIFVPNQTFDYQLVSKIKQQTKMIIDTHLMIQNPENDLDKYLSTNADILCFHIESTDNPSQIIQKIHQKGLKCGIAIKPNTSVDDILNYLNEIDLVLVMSVEPGFGGQKFIEETLLKVELLNQLRQHHQYHYLIEMDGGINNQNSHRIKERGADIIVVGTYLFKSENFIKTVMELEK